MINSFKRRGLKWFFVRGDIRKIAPEHHRKVADILTTLDAAQDIEDMNLATFHLHQLTRRSSGGLVCHCKGKLADNIHV